MLLGELTELIKISCPCKPGPIVDAANGAGSGIRCPCLGLQLSIDYCVLLFLQARCLLYDLSQLLKRMLVVS
jgi:hypothetical protein